MRHADMNIQPIDGSTYMTVISTGLYVLTVILDSAPILKGLAGVAAIAAGFSTVAYNCFRFYRDYKAMQKEKKE